MSFTNMAFLPAVLPHTRSSFTPARTTCHPLLRPQTQNVAQRRCSRAIKATFQEDFFTGPSSPPRPRPLYQVILFSVTTNLLWYGYYKYCIEEELRNETGSGLGGIGVLAPFTAMIAGPLYAPTGGPAEALVAGAIIWIVSIQFALYRRINTLMLDKEGYAPLVPWWVVIPGYNLVAGLRGLHFLAVAWGFPPDEDPIVQKLPFLGVKTLGMKEFATKPSLWLKL